MLRAGSAAGFTPLGGVMLIFNLAWFRPRRKPDSAAAALRGMQTVILAMRGAR